MVLAKSFHSLLSDESDLSVSDAGWVQSFSIYGRAKLSCEQQFQICNLCHNLADNVVEPAPQRSLNDNTKTKTMSPVTSLCRVGWIRCLNPIVPVYSSFPLLGLQSRCLSQHLSQHLIAGSPGYRNFSNSPSLYKKREKSNPSTSTNNEESVPKTAPSDDPYDLSQLHNGIAAALSNLKDDLSKLRGGGRFDTNSIESLRVKLSRASKETLRLGDLAQVIPKGGRMVTVLAAEEDHVKPIISAIISSDLSLTPQADSHNALQLNIPIPPPTKESRDQAITMAKKAMERAAAAVRDSRGLVHKRLQDMQKKKTARPDDVRKAQEQMEKVSEKGQKDVKELLEAAKKAMERA